MKTFIWLQTRDSKFTYDAVAVSANSLIEAKNLVSDYFNNKLQADIQSWNKSSYGKDESKKEFTQSHFKRLTEMCKTNIYEVRMNDPLVIEHKVVEELYFGTE